MSSLYDRRSTSATTSPHYIDSPTVHKQNGTIDIGGLGEMNIHSLRKANLYVFGEKTQMKVKKIDF